MGSSIIPKDVVSFQAWNSVDWQTIDDKSELSKLARKELDRALKEEIKNLKPVTDEQIEEALRQVQKDDQEAFLLAKSVVIKGKILWFKIPGSNLEHYLKSRPTKKNARYQKKC